MLQPQAPSMPAGRAGFRGALQAAHCSWSRALEPECLGLLGHVPGAPRFRALNPSLSRPVVPTQGDAVSWDLVSADTFGVTKGGCSWHLVGERPERSLRVLRCTAWSL